ncbi:MAG: TIGR03790 family protein [Planctomycetes bacterium]|nr:TIGR03790 family protein [Planctomycetota bacterium]
MLTAALAALVLQVATPLARDVDPAKHVVVLVNEAVPESVALGEAYCRARGVPLDNVCRVRTTADEVIAWPAFQAEVLAPVRAFVARHPDAVYLVPTWGVPVKIAEHVKDDLPPAADPMRRHVTSVDAACVDRELELVRGDLPDRPGWVESRTWRLDRPVTAEDGVLVVVRLDGPTPEHARALIDLALHGELYGVEGTHLLDTRGLTGAGDGYATYDAELRQVAGVFARHGLPLRHDDQGPVVDLSTIEGGPGHYWGWYTGTLEAAAPFRFAPGAVACHVHSFSADTLRHPKRNWVGPLLDRGATVAIGTVYEPLTAGFPTAPLFWERFLAGHTVGQALQLSNRFTSWMAVYVGDPLYAPYSAQARAAQAENRALVAGAAARLEALLDAGDLDEAAAVVARLDALPVPYRGGDGGGLRLLAREVRARRATGKAGEGTVAALRAALAGADDALGRGDWAQAQREAQRALAVSPGSYEANLALGRALLGLGKDATGPLERAAALEPDDPEALGPLCRALLARNRAEAALAAARRAGLPHLEGEALVALERWDAARARLEAARAARPRDRRLALAHGRAPGRAPRAGGGRGPAPGA